MHRVRHLVSLVFGASAAVLLIAGGAGHAGAQVDELEEEREADAPEVVIESETEVDRRIGALGDLPDSRPPLVVSPDSAELPIVPGSEERQPPDGVSRYDVQTPYDADTDIDIIVPEGDVEVGTAAGEAGAAALGGAGAGAYYDPDERPRVLQESPLYRASQLAERGASAERSRALSEAELAAEDTFENGKSDLAIRLESEEDLLVSLRSSAAGETRDEIAAALDRIASAEARLRAARTELQRAEREGSASAARAELHKAERQARDALALADQVAVAD